MAGLAPCTPLERLAHERDALVAWLARQFPRALTIEDAEDLVADALPSLASDPHLPSGGRARRAYLHRALRRDAIDELRHRHGRSPLAGPRSVVSLDAAVQLSDPAADPERGLHDDEERAQRHSTVERTLPRLRSDDAEVLRLRYLEQRAPDEVAAELGITRTQYERRLARAGQRGLDVLATTTSGPACAPVRALLDRDEPQELTRDDAARVDVHLTDCLHCRAFALRTRGLLELGLPALGFVDRVAARIGTLLGRGGDAALRAGPDAALASGAAGAGTAITAGLTTKLAISCASVAVAAVCAGPLAHELTPKHNDRTATATHEHDRPARHKTRPATTPQPTVTVAASATITVTPSPTPTARPERTPSRQRTTRQERRRRNREAAVREFGPESATPDVTTQTTASAAATTGQTNAPPPPPQPPKPATSSSFSEEFRP